MKSTDTDLVRVACHCLARTIAHAFGPHTTDLAEKMAEQVRIWDREQRRGPGPNFAVWPLDTPDERLPEGLVITKRHHRITISWLTL